jgi:hypothetical protein
VDPVPDPLLFSLVVPGIEPGLPDLQPRTLTTRPQRRSSALLQKPPIIFFLRRVVTPYNKIYLTNYQTPWGRILPEKLIIAQLVKNVPEFYRLRRLDTVTTTINHWFLTLPHVSGLISAYAKELLDRKIAAPVYKTDNTAVGIRHADHVAPSIDKKLAITSPTSGGRSVGIVPSRTQTMQFFFLYVGILNRCLHPCIVFRWNVRHIRRP